MALMAHFACGLLLILAPLRLWGQSALRVLQNTPQQIILELETPEAILHGANLAKSAVPLADSIAPPPGNPFQHTRLVLLSAANDPVVRVEASGVTPVALQESPFAFSAQHAELADAGWWRGFRLGRLVINPVIRTASGELRLARKIRVRLEFPAPSSTVAQSPVLLSHAEKAVLKQVLNGHRANFFRRKKPLQAVLPAIPQSSNGPQVKIYVRETGMVQLTRTALEATGFPVGSTPPKHLRLQHRGKDVPLFFIGDADSLFEAGERFWFWGERLAGEQAWFNDETDLNVYWLAADSAAGMRFETRPIGDNRNLPLAPHFWQTRHFEEDRSYYHGDDDEDIFTTARIPGEGWIWTRLLAGESFSTTMALENVATDAPACSLFARVRGITRDHRKPNHHLTFWVNDTQVGDVAFSDNDDILLRAAIPAALLRGGDNTIKLVSVGDTGAAIDQVYLDWLEIGYWRRYSAVDNRLRFSAPAAAGSDSVRYRVESFASRDLLLFDLANATRLTGFSIDPNGQAEVALEFAAAASTPHAYLALAGDAARAPVALQLTTPSTLGSPGRGADAIILSHADFLPAARRLAAHRAAGSGLRLQVVPVQEVYDAFNFGIRSAQAIRDFLAYAFANWQPPAPAYVLFFGDGTWDPKKNAAGSQKNEFIPVFGNPVSDNRLVCLDGPDDFLPDLFVGRLAVETLAEAEAVVDKIIAYESQPLQDWGKDFLFLTGGINSYERNLFQSQAEKLIGEFVQPPPVAGKPLRLFKISDGRIPGELLPEILQTLNDGVIQISFAGHAGSRTWELMMVNEDIPKLQNQGRLPFIASMTCHTARFGNPAQNSFGEDFLRLPQAGAIAFWGTSGWGFVFQDGILLEGLFQAITRDSVRALGVATTLAKLHLWQRYGAFQININLIDQYTLLGDPMLELALPKKPDFALRPGQISFTPEAPTESDSLVGVRVVLRNRGLVPEDSTRLLLRTVAAMRTAEKFEAQVQVGSTGYADTLWFDWPGRGRRGEITLEAVADSDNRIDEVDETNNRAQKSLYFYSTSVDIADPLDLQVLPETQPQLAVYNSFVTPGAVRKVYFEIDSSRQFNSLLRRISPALEPGEVRTVWRVPAPLPPGRYFWRSRTEQQGVFSAWQIATLFIDPTLAHRGFRQAGDVWHGLAGAFQLSRAGVTLPADSARRLSLQVRSGGAYDQNLCELSVNGEIVNRDGRGHNVLAIDPVRQEFIAPPRAFDTFTSSVAADSMAAFLENLPAGTILLAGIRADGSAGMTERAHRALEQFGSGRSRQVQFNDSWALIGMKGQAPGTAIEMHKPSGSGMAVVADSLLPFARRSTLVSPAIGPARQWTSLEWRTAAPLHLLPDSAGAGVALGLTVFGRKGPQDAWVQVAGGISGNSWPLQGIDARRFPYLQLRAELEDDDGMNSPVLRSWQIEYEPAGDLVLPAHRVQLKADSLLPGEAFQLSATVFYFGEARLDSVTVRLWNPEANAASQVLGEKILALAPDGRKDVAFQWEHDSPGKTALQLVVDPENRFAEPFEINNTVHFTTTVMPDTTPPELVITFDGAEITETEFIAPQPEIVCAIYDKSPLAIRDSSNVAVFLDDVRLVYAGGSGVLEFRKSGSGDLRAEVVLRPHLSPGTHRFTFLVRDYFGQATVKNRSVQVSEELELRNVMNYPNPFSSETEFTFTLTQPVDWLQIKIYTVNGRLIRTLETLPGVGFNSVRWDGRDADGDFLANGVYLYKLVARQGEKQAERVEKLAIAR